MKVSSSTPQVNQAQTPKGVKHLYTEKLTKDEVKELRAEIVKNTNAFTFNATASQNNIFKSEDKFAQEYKGFQDFLQGIGYEGKPIAELSKDEAAALVSEDGMFGIKQTAERIADFVINGSGGDEDRMRAGREGMLLGFKQAEEMWGGKLPEISQKTMQSAIEKVDKAMYDLGFSILNQEA